MKLSKTKKLNAPLRFIQKLMKYLHPMLSEIKKYPLLLFKVAIAAVAGPQRTGKSFLSNRLLQRMDGFAIGPSTMPCTKGLWIWGEPVKVS